MQFCMLNWPLEATKGQIGGGSLLQIDLYDVYKVINYVQSFMLLSKSAQNYLFLRLRSSTKTFGQLSTN